MLAPVDPESLLTGGAGGVAGALLNRDIFRDQYVVDPNEGRNSRFRCVRARRTRPGSGQLIQQASMDTIDSRQVDFIARSQFGGVGSCDSAFGHRSRDRGRAGRQAAMTAGGLFAQSPATAARDVQFVLTTAERRTSRTRIWSRNCVT